MSFDQILTTSSKQSASANDAVGSGARPSSASDARKRNENTEAVEVRQKHEVVLGGEADSTTMRRGLVGWKGTPSSKKSVGNELSRLMPGYTAPMRLESKSLKGIARTSLAELRNRAARGESTMYSPFISILDKKEDTFDPTIAAKKVKTPSSIGIQKITGGGGKMIPTSFSSSFRKAPRKQHDSTAGSGWFGMNPTTMTVELKTDLTLIRNRNYLDPKKFYKSADSFEGKVLQVGTVIEGNSEFYSSRLAKRDRKQNLTEELMADAGVANYAKRKYYDLQMERAKPKKKVSKRGRKRRCER